jgi:hypothetical protein
MERRLSTVLALAISLPVVAATAWMLVIMAGERAGAAPFSAPPWRNSAEAAAAGDAATMLLLIRQGDDPTRVHHVPPGLISSAIARVTTLEAAIWSRSISMIRVLDREGAIVGADQRHDLACLAVDLDAPETADYLVPAAQRTCVPGRAADRVAQRSRVESAHDKE